MQMFQHADGGYYVRCDTAMRTEMKCPETGKWLTAVLYRPIIPNEGGVTRGYSYDGSKQFVTTAQRWADRFTEVQP